jgi:predicted  nucleic acid-binding Zn-ribbon protein
MTDDLVKEMRRFLFHDRINEKPWEAVELIDAAAARIEELHRQLAASDKQIKDLEDEIESLEYEMCELENRS